MMMSSLLWGGCSFSKLPLSWLCQGSLGAQNTAPPSPQLMQQGSTEGVGSALFKGRTENLETDFKFSGNKRGGEVYREMNRHLSSP